MKNQNLAEVFGKLLSHDQAFVFYRLPYSNIVHCFFQDDSTLNLTPDLKIEGFVMSRFYDPLPVPYISNKNRLEFKYIPNFRQNNVLHNGDLLEDKSTFINVVNKTKSAIASGLMKKLVVARGVRINEEVDSLKMFTNLLSLYPSAMVYYWNHPKAETWIGASPEQLFSTQSGRLTTMALAGTLLYNDQEKYHWDVKEKVEQGWVRDTLYKDLKNLFPKNEVKCSETFTQRAGNLVHLCNILTVDSPSFNILELIKTLHPTPAVGGIPVKEGIQFLTKNEKLDRAYYAGFLGPLWEDTQIDLFVNLRCAQIIKEGLLLYVGAGITSDSDPEKEWEETQNKTKTLLAAL